MNISNTLAASFSLGLLTCLSGTALGMMGDDPRVRVVELLDDSGSPWIGFSDQGDTLTLRREISDESGGVGVELYKNQGQGWELVKRVFAQDFFALIPFGISDDGAVIGETDFENVNLIEGAASTRFSRNWHDTQSGVFGWHMQGEVLSGDGQRVGVTGKPMDENYSDALLWDGESRFINLSWGLDQERRSYPMRGLSFDGTVAVFGAVYLAPLNNIRSFGSERDVWVWEDGELTMVPPIAADYEVVMRAAGISGDGQAVIGSVEGIWRPGFDDDDRVYDGSSHHLIHSPQQAWIWTQETGTVEIADRARFEEVGVSDITHDASTVLGNGYSPDTGSRQFLWYRDGNQFVMIDDLFAKLGIVIDADSYSFFQISGDGSKLLGVSRLGEERSAIIVTIPVRKP